MHNTVLFLYKNRRNRSYGFDPDPHLPYVCVLYPARSLLFRSRRDFLNFALALLNGIIAHKQLNTHKQYGTKHKHHLLLPGNVADKYVTLIKFAQSFLTRIVLCYLHRLK